jgi:hypothetical protein
MTRAGVQLTQNGADSDGHKDMVAFIVIDLRAVLAAKPGGTSVSSMTSGLLRGLPMGVRTTIDESIGKWAVDTEKFIRETLLQFFVYIFAGSVFKYV